MSFFFFHAPTPTETYTLSLHDALPIWSMAPNSGGRGKSRQLEICAGSNAIGGNRAPPHGGMMSLAGRSMRRSEEHTLNSSHTVISYAVFCLKKKKNKKRKKKK